MAAQQDAPYPPYELRVLKKGRVHGAIAYAPNHLEWRISHSCGGWRRNKTRLIHPTSYELKKVGCISDSVMHQIIWNEAFPILAVDGGATRRALSTLRVTS